jgi:hypothetical protein
MPETLFKKIMLSLSLYCHVFLININEFVVCLHIWQGGNGFSSRVRKIGLVHGLHIDLDKYIGYVEPKSRVHIKALLCGQLLRYWPAF